MRNNKRNKIVWVPAMELKPHQSAQRKLVPTQVKRLMANLDLDAIGTMHVADIGGQLWIIDGQHRWTALMRHGLGEWKVRCEVHEDVVDHARASDLFLKLNTRVAVGTYDKYINEVQAGDEIAVGAQQVAEQCGLRVDRQATDGNIVCVNALKKLYEIDRGQTLGETIEMAITAWGHTAAAVEGKLLEGLGLVLARFNGEVDRPTLAKKLAKYPGGASGIVGDARGLKKIRRASVPVCVAETIVETYNSGRREANRLPVS